MSNALDILESNSNSSRGQRWQRNKTETNLSEAETVVTEFTAMSSGRTILQVRVSVALFYNLLKKDFAQLHYSNFRFYNQMKQLW